MTKLVKLALIVAITFLFGQLFYALANNVSDVAGYNFFGLEDVFGEHVCGFVIFYSTWYFVFPLAALTYSGIWRQITGNGTETSKGKNTH